MIAPCRLQIPYIMRGPPARLHPLRSRRRWRSFQSHIGRAVDCRRCEAPAAVRLAGGRSAPATAAAGCWLRKPGRQFATLGWYIYTVLQGYLSSVVTKTSATIVIFVILKEHKVDQKYCPEEDRLGLRRRIGRECNTKVVGVCTNQVRHV